MTAIDYLVLLVYFLGMAGIGLWAMRKVKKQEDFFMGGRQFGKFLQTFAAFGAGTGSADPVNTARTTFTSGVSGMWSVMYWLFVTPIYWITGVWYRRMRCLTLGDWFVERYESKSIGVAYALFGLLYYMVYGSMLFSAIGKVAAPLMGDSIMLLGNEVGLEYALVPVIALIVIAYGVLGGLTAAYWTDVVQGICIIVLSIILIPFGLAALVERFGDPATQGMMSGFKIMHQQLPEHYFTLVGSGTASQFPLLAIVLIVLINIVGIVVTPHFIVTGGGSARSEQAARIGLVSGNLIKRFCTVGWVLTALIILTLFSSRPELQADPDKTWGIATLELLGPAGIGLVGLMLACLLAALMSSVDTYMLVCAGLVVRNVYVPYVHENASEQTCLRLGRIVGGLVVVGSVLVSWYFMDVFQQLQLTWVVPMTFAGPFWIGMYWRRATAKAAWGTVLICVILFFILPRLIPAVAPSLRTNATCTQTSHFIETTTVRRVSPSDVARRDADIRLWQEQAAAAADNAPALASLGPAPSTLIAGDQMKDVKKTPGTSIFWSGGVKPAGEPRFKLVEESVEGSVTTTRRVYDCELVGQGSFRPDLLIYHWMGIDLASMRNAYLSTLDLPFKIVVPFLVMILLSLCTTPNRKEALDRFYVKMKTPVDPNPIRDQEEMRKSYQDPHRFDHRKLFRHPNIEIQRPTAMDFWGVIACFGVCFVIIGLMYLIARLGA